MRYSTVKSSPILYMRLCAAIHLHAIEVIPIALSISVGAARIYDGSFYITGISLNNSLHISRSSL